MRLKQTAGTKPLGQIKTWGRGRLWCKGEKGKTNTKMHGGNRENNEQTGKKKKQKNTG